MGEEQQSSVNEQQDAADGQEAATAVKRGGMVVAAVIVLSLLWYLASDRFAPYTTQARVDGYVIGVAPQVAGLVTDVWVRNNQSVEEGDRLFQIDPSQYEIALMKAQSDYENTVRQVEAGDATVAASRANLAAALANLDKAQKDTRRLRRLREEDQGTISARRLEVSEASLDQAKAGVAAAEADIKRAIESKGGDSEAENTLLKIARSAVEKAQLDLDRTVVKASSGGIITDLRADVGQFAGAGQAVMTLIAVHDLWVHAEYTENNLGHLKQGTPVEILFDVLPGQVFEGRVRSIGLGVGSSQPPPPGTLPTIENQRDWLRQAQRFPVQVEFAVSQAPELAQNLRIGGQASVVAYTEEAWLTALLGKLYIRVMSLLAYAY
jgi:multidrug resistance efflux pump